LESNAYNYILRRLTMGGFYSMGGIGTVIAADNVDFSGDPNPTPQLVTDGQILIAQTGSYPVSNTLTEGYGQTVVNGSGSITLIPQVYTQFVVDPTSGNSDYQTVQDAIDAANTAGGGTVLIRQGTYTEDLTLYDKVDLQGAVARPDGEPVVIEGTHTPPASGYFNAQHIHFKSATDVFYSTDAGTAILSIDACNIEITNGYLFNVPNWTGKIDMFDIDTEFSTSDGGINNTAGAEVVVVNSGLGRGTGNTATLSGFSILARCCIYAPVSMTSTSTLMMEHANVHEAFSFDDDSSGTVSNSYFVVSGSAAITYDTTGNVYLGNVTIDCDNDPAIDGSGAGDLKLGSVTYIDNQNVAAAVNKSFASRLETGELKVNDSKGGVLFATTGVVDSTAAGTTGTVLIGTTGSDPSFSASPSVTSISISDSPSNSTDGVNKSYVDSIASGFDHKDTVIATTTADLNATYDNGASGVGATLTNAGAQTAFSIDGVTLSAGQRVLIKDQTDAFENGVYTVTTEGDGATNWVLTRATDYDEVAEMGNGSLVPVKSGTQYPNTTWMQSTTVTTIGTDDIDYNKFQSTPISTTEDSVLIGDQYDGVKSQALTDGQLLIGDTGNAPTASTLTAGTGINITNASGSITLSTSGGGMSWETITANQTLEVNHGYICVSAGGDLELALPTTSSVGDKISVTLDGATSWKITQASGQQIRLGTSETTSGTTGYLESTAQGDSVNLVCVTADTRWVQVGAPQGNITVN
jgi:hypothetical protein